MGENSYQYYSAILCRINPNSSSITALNRQIADYSSVFFYLFGPLCNFLLNAMKRYDFKGLYLLRPVRGAAYCNQFVCLSVCLSVCRFANISLELLDRSLQNLLCRSPVAVARCSSGGVAIAARSLMSMNALFLLCCVRV